MNKHLKVESFQETLNAGMCGPASLKIVFDYYGVNKSEKEIAEMAGATKDLGTDVDSLTRVAKQLGFKVAVKNNSNFIDIEKWLMKGVLPIVD